MAVGDSLLPSIYREVEPKPVLLDHSKVYSPFSGGYTTVMIDRLPRLEKTAFCVSPLTGPSDEKAYWLSKTPGERLEALEIMRQIVYGYDPTTTRLQRLFEIAQRASR